MTTEFAIELLVYGGIVPAGIALAAVYLAGRICSEDAQRYAMAVGMALAFWGGYLLLPDWAKLAPARHWHWLPYIAVAATVLGPVGLARGVSTVERWLLYALVAIIAAWLFVPTRLGFDAARGFYVALAATYFGLLMVLLDPLPMRIAAAQLLAYFTLAAVCVAVFLGLFAFSNTYMQVAGIAAAATFGCCLGTCFHATETMIRGIFPVFTVLVGGLGFIGFIALDRPLIGMLLVPAAPLALWPCTWGPLSRFTGAKALGMQILAVFLVLSSGGVLAWLAP